MFSALFGVYSIPLLRRMRPVRRKTSMTCVIANCTTVLLLSSALPVLARTLGEFFVKGSSSLLYAILQVSHRLTC